ncbi:hypothetical protein NZJ93_10725 [Desulfofundulus thermocisternus]|nr:hypothetical protein [Desulfofundulus thermocisternus]
MIRYGSPAAGERKVSFPRWPAALDGKEVVTGEAGVKRKQHFREESK